MKILVQVSGGIILLLGAFYSLNIANSMKENNKLIEKGNIAERFKNSIIMLDDKNSNTCLGGIYALINIANDNKEYREQVFNILVEFINNRTKTLPSWQELDKPTRLSSQPSIEITTILKLLFSKESSIYINFNAHLENAKLYGALLDDYNFSRCSFRNVEFQNSSFLKTWFIESKFYYTDFTFSDFANAYLTISEIWDKSSLACCRFSWTHFTGCFIQGVDFSCSRMMDVYFEGARVNHCSFSGVEIVKFDKGSFVGSSFSSISSKGLVCSGNGLIARGAKFEQGLLMTGFTTNMKAFIGEEAKIKTENKLEDFPEEELEKFKNLLDINSPTKFYCHTLSSIEHGHQKTTGWVFSDTGIFTEEDSKTIFDNYEFALKKLTERNE